MARMHLYSLLASTLLAIAVVLGLYGASTHLMHREMAHQAGSVIKLMNHLNRDAQTSWQRLTNSYSTPCSEQQLVEMRAELFLTWHIRDIGYTEGGQVLCTASQGRLASPIALPQVTYATDRGAQIWIDKSWQVLGSPHNVAIAQRGNFILVVDPRSLENFIDLPYAWELTYSVNNTDYHAAGERGLSGVGQDQHSYLADFRTQACNEINYCVTVLSDTVTYLSRNWTASFLILVLGYLFGWFAYVRIRRYLHHLHSIEFRVRQGLNRGAFYPLVQPVVDLANQKIIGCEVLARFKDKRGDLYPDQFIPVVANQGLSWPFTLAIVERALAELKEFNLEEKVSVAFNFMPRDITNGNVLELIKHPMVSAWRGSLTIELTESEEFEGDEAHQVLYKLKQAGFTIAIDDFGTGYSNLKYIDQLHCSYLKIDRTFVMDVEEGAIRSSIIPYIVSIADKADLKVIAEGVENLAQATELHRMGVKYVQGYFYGRPMPIKQLAEKIDD